MMIVDTLHGILFNPDIGDTMLVQNSYIVSGIVVAYIFFVKRLGPTIMRNRKPMDLKYIIIAFNAAVMVLNMYLCVIIARTARTYMYDRCYLKYNPNFLEHSKREGYIGFQVLILKIVELFDTVFFVLRKKSDHISFLHVFHHSLVVGLFWIILKTRELGYYLLLAGVINCFIHVVMYAYYGLAAMGPSMQKYLWWKKYITRLQIGQFFIVMFYMLHAFLTDCEELGFFEKVCFFNLCVILALFINFYIGAYRKK